VPVPSSLTEVLAHPCSLLEIADVEPLLGTSDLEQQQQPGPPGDARCAYFVKSGRGIVELYFHVPSRKADFDKSPTERDSISGIGDRAYADKRLTVGHVDVLEGDQTFFVQIVPSQGGPLHGAGARTAATQLARTIAGRIAVEASAKDR
jgi:hypothetical protein